MQAEIENNILLFPSQILSISLRSLALHRFTQNSLKSTLNPDPCRFPNDPCPGNGNGKNGTCYTADECASRNGVSSGSCAQGYGVCCTFSVSCGASSAENCTYFESTGSESGSCSVDICR